MRWVIRILRFVARGSKKGFRRIIKNAVLVIAALILAAIVWLKVPEQIVNPQRDSAGNVVNLDDRKLISEYRRTIGQMLFGTAIFVGIYLTWRRIRATEKQVAISEQGQITDRFTKAIEQLGSEKLELRLGAIFALERIAKDSKDDHWTIMEVLTAYIRERSGAKESRETQDESTETGKGDDEIREENRRKPAADIQATITVIGRRVHRKEEKHRLNLMGAYINRADLQEAHLEGANLSEAHLEGADLRGAHLKEANLSEAHLARAHLEEADLRGAHLKEANLREAHLERADLQGANLREAHLERADLEGANLGIAHLQGANLSEAHLEGADLRGTHLARADLEGANLGIAQLKGADLRGAQLKGADLMGAQLARADLKGANLENITDLTQEQIKEAILDENTQLPEGLVWKKGIE